MEEKNKGIENMKLSDIKISRAFGRSLPSEEKMAQHRLEYAEDQLRNRCIVVDKRDYLRDGYCTYLVLKENGIEETGIKRCRMNWRKKKHGDNVQTAPTYLTEPTVYIYGCHMNRDGAYSREYVWRMTKAMCKSFGEDFIKAGDLVKVSTCKGKKVVQVTKVEKYDKPPIDKPIRKVCCKYIKKEKIQEDGFAGETVTDNED
jgi:hypothetical protein